MIFLSLRNLPVVISNTNPALMTSCSADDMPTKKIDKKTTKIFISDDNLFFLLINAPKEIDKLITKVKN